MQCDPELAAWIEKHWAGPAQLKATPSGWRGPCLICGVPRALWIQVRDGRILADGKCRCDKRVTWKALQAIAKPPRQPPHTARHRRARRPARDMDELISLVLATIPPQSKLLGVLEWTGMGTAEALGKLGVGRTHRGRVIGPLRRFSRVTETGTKPQVEDTPGGLPKWVHPAGKIAGHKP